MYCPCSRLLIFHSSVVPYTALSQDSPHVFTYMLLKIYTPSVLSNGKGSSYFAYTGLSQAEDWIWDYVTGMDQDQRVLLQLSAAWPGVVVGDVQDVENGRWDRDHPSSSRLDTTWTCLDPSFVCSTTAGSSPVC